MLRKILSLTLSISLLFQYSGFAQSINLADYLSQGHNPVALDRFRPLALRYFSYEPSVDNFKILLDKGDQKDLIDTKIKDEADRLLTYFKIGLSLPNEKFWVNLRPDAQDQIIDPELEKTDLGKVLLEADLQLKKDTSSLTSPQSKEGKVYWDKLYKKAGELFGTENITIPTITRPWIVPGEIIVRESKESGSTSLTTSAYIYKAVLKVMLEEDYLADQKTSPQKNLKTEGYNFSDPRLKELNRYSTELIKETILPELTKRINSSKDYASLRQVFFSLILARWFKDAFGSSGRISAPENSYVKLINSQDLTNLTSKESWSKTAYFNEYNKSFAQGEYNLSEKIYTPTGQVIRRYTSGGAKIMPGKGAIESFVVNSSPVTRKDMFQITEEGNQKVGSPLVEDAVEGGQSLSAASSALGFFEGRKKTLKTMEDEINGMLESIFLSRPSRMLTYEEKDHMRKVKYDTVDEILYAARKIINYWKGKINGNEPLFSDLELKLNAVAEKTYAKMEYSYKKMLERYFEKNKTKILEKYISINTGKNLLSDFGEVDAYGKFELKEGKIEEAMEYVRDRRMSKYEEWSSGSIIGGTLEWWYSWENPVNEFMKVKQFIGEGKPLAEESQNKNISSSAVELKYKTDEFKNLLAGILGVIKKIKPSKEIDKDLTMLDLDLKNADEIKREIASILEKMDSVSDLNGIREKVHAAIVNLLSYADSGRIDKEFGKLKELYASLNANILANRFYSAGLTKSKLKEITTKDIKSIEKENNGHGLPVSYYVSRYHLLGPITVEGADYLVKVYHDEHNKYKIDYKSGLRPHRIIELVPKDNPDTLEPLIRFRVFDDGIAPEISYAGHKEPKKKDSNEPPWKEAKREAFSGLFNANPQEVDKLQKGLVNEVERVLNGREGVSSSLARLTAISPLTMLALRMIKWNLRDYEVLNKIFEENFKSVPEDHGKLFLLDNLMDGLRDPKSNKKEVLSNAINKVVNMENVSTVDNMNKQKLEGFLLVGFTKYYQDITGFVKSRLTNFQLSGLDNPQKSLVSKIETLEKYLGLAAASEDDTKIVPLLDMVDKMWLDCRHKPFTEDTARTIINKYSSSSLENIIALGANPDNVVGGIDFRQMNMLIQPQGSFASSSLDFSLPALSRAEIESFDLDKELELIQRMASSGIDPIDERLKKYLAVCFARGRTGKEIDELKLCLEDVFTAQQLDARQTPDGYKEVIVIADTRRYVVKESRLAASKGNIVNLN